MCGIIASFKYPNKDPKDKSSVNETIINQYQDQKGRGSEGFGIIRIKENQKIEIDRGCDSVKFLLDLYTKPSKMIIAHHRLPTSTKNKISQTHPIVVSNSLLIHDYLVIHNGIVTNDEKLKEIHNQLGFQYTTEISVEPYYYRDQKSIKWNDSEALAIEVAMFIEKSKDNIEITNGAAFIAVQIDKKTNKAKEIYFGQNGAYSMNMDITSQGIEISSEGPGDKLEPNILYNFDPKDKKLKINKREMPFKETIKEPENETIITTFPQHQITQTGLLNTDPLAEKEDNEGDLRSWTKNEQEAQIKDTDLATYADEKYISTTCKEFKADCKEETPTTIKTLLEERLDSEQDKIQDVIIEFTSYIKNHKIHKELIYYYIEQIETFMKTMNAMTNIADKEYEKAKETNQESIDQENYYDQLEKQYDEQVGGPVHYMGERTKYMGFHNFRNDF